MDSSLYLVFCSILCVKSLEIKKNLIFKKYNNNKKLVWDHILFYDNRKSWIKIKQLHFY